MEKVLLKQKKNQEAKRNIGTIKSIDSFGSVNGIKSNIKPQGRNSNGARDQFASSLGKSN